MFPLGKNKHTDIIHSLHKDIQNQKSCFQKFYPKATGSYQSPVWTDEFVNYQIFRNVISKNPNVD